MENKPKVLYRGLKLDYNALQDYVFTGVDMKVNYTPIIDKYGRKTVKDGNEYGVYMSDNLRMVSSAYGDLHHDGIPINKTLTINGERIMIPSIGVIYQIDTSNLNIRKPFISTSLNGVYNNGFEGEEWIADIVPADKYSIYRVRIGDDILHKTEDLDLSTAEDVSEFIKQKMEMRKYRLEVFANAMAKMTKMQIATIGNSEMDILKSIYGENGIKYINEENLDTTKVENMIKYLIAKTVKQNEADIDFTTIKYINSLEAQAKDIDSLLEVLQKAKLKNEQAKATFIDRKQKAGITTFTTSLFDTKAKTIDNLIAMILLRKKKDEQHIQSEDNDLFPDATPSEIQDWQKIKRVYNYDNLSESMQKRLENDFRKMLNNHQRKNIDSDELLDTDDFDEESPEKIERIGRRL